MISLAAPSAVSRLCFVLLLSTAITILSCKTTTEYMCLFPSLQIMHSSMKHQLLPAVQYANCKNRCAEERSVRLQPLLRLCIAACAKTFNIFYFMSSICYARKLQGAEGLHLKRLSSNPHQVPSRRGAPEV